MERLSTSQFAAARCNPLGWGRRWCGRFVLLLSVGLVAQPVLAESNSWGMSTQEKQIYDYGPGGSNGTSRQGTILDSTNPIDLMNKIRRSQALDDATPPSDAVDQALREYSTQTGPAVASPAQSVKAP